MNSGTSIIQVYKEIEPAIGGVARVMEELFQGRPPDFEVTSLSTRRYGLPPVPGRQGIRHVQCFAPVYIRSLPVSPGLPLAMRRLARQAQCVVLHHPFPLGDMGRLMGLPETTALVVHWHSEIVRQRMLGRALRPLIQGTLRRADRIIVSSRELQHHSPSLADWAHKCEVVPFGVDASQWVPDAAEQASAEGIRQSHPPFVAFLGRLVYYKGLDVLIDAVAHTPGVCVAIIGDGPMRKRLERRVQREGLGERIWLTGALPRAEVRAWFAASRGVVLPSISSSETFGLVQLEAMATGRAVINTDIHPAVSRVARHEQEGLTVPASDAGALGQAMRRLCEDGALAQRLGEAGARRVREHYSNQAFAAACYDIYREAITARRGAGHQTSGGAEE